MKITRYFPGFASGFDDEPIVAEFNSVDELMEIEWVKNWSKLSPWRGSRYSISGRYLMADFYNPREWWVVGILAEPYKLELPKFVAK
jgi:hypothetical protein